MIVKNRVKNEEVEKGSTRGSKSEVQRREKVAKLSGRYSNFHKMTL